VTRRAFCVVKSPTNWGLPTRTTSTSWMSCGTMLATRIYEVRMRMIVLVVSAVVAGSILSCACSEINCGSHVECLI
jgi:hypothetical protein